MNNIEQVPPRTGSAFPTLTIATSLAAIVATFVLANSSAAVASKTKGFSAIIAAFLVVCAFLFLRSRRRDPEEVGTIDRHLASLDEAKEYFAGALNSSDTFRLVASRIRAITPFVSACLWLVDDSRSTLRMTDAVGQAADERKGDTQDFGEGIAGRCYDLAAVVTGSEPFSIGEQAVQSVAIPLLRDDRVFAVLQIFLRKDAEPDATDVSVYEAIGSRVGPLVLSSIAFDRSQANALTDVTTNFPNERAFYLVLENQIAECLRRGEDERPLTVLTMDIKGFDEVNRRFGHTAGDLLLNEVAKTIKDNLRQMDFFCRAMNDEFLAVMPTASKEISTEIMARINSAFFSRKIKVSDTMSVEVELSFGWATFGEDGETADRLVGVARLRKEQTKYSSPHKVLHFSRELVN